MKQMNSAANDLLEMLLRECAAAAPEPWYPSPYVEKTGLDRAIVDADLDRLRVGGLVRLTDWAQGKGQGYTLTPEGADVLQNARLLRQLRNDGVAAVAVEPVERLQAEGPSPWDRGEAVRAVFLTPAKPVITFSLLAANILVFLAGIYMVLQRGESVDKYLGFSDDAGIGMVRTNLGALKRSTVVIDDEWWRLITYCFVHGGLLHLLLNMYFLYSLGPLVESMFGSVRYLILYLISGVGGGCAVVVLTDQSAVGASGALCGLLASMGVWAYLNRPYLGPDLSSRLLRATMTNILLIVIISLMPRISAMGHLGGGVAGAVVAVPLVFHRFGRGAQRLLGALGTVAVLLIEIGLVTASITDRDRAQKAVVQAELATESARKIRGPLVRADHAAQQALTNLAPFLEDKASMRSLFDDAAALAKASREVSNARESLKHAQQELDKADLSGPELKKAVTIATEYIENWSAVFDILAPFLERKTPLTDQEFETIDDKLTPNKKLAVELKASAIFAP